MKFFKEALKEHYENETTTTGTSVCDVKATCAWFADLACVLACPATCLPHLACVATCIGTTDLINKDHRRILIIKVY